MTPGATLALVLAGLVAVQRLSEMVRSRRHLVGVEGPAADPRGNWVAMVALHTAWLAGVGTELVLAGDAAPAAGFALGLGLLVAGNALRLRAIHTLGRAWNARAVVPRELVVVTDGPYRFCRHPNYTGVLLEWIGLPLLAGAWVTLAVTLPLWCLVQLRRVRGEDELLARVPGYAEAMGAKPALFPRLFGGGR